MVRSLRRLPVLLSGAMAATLIAGCGSTTPAGDSGTAGRPTASVAQQPDRQQHVAAAAASVAPGTRATKVLLIVEENHGPAATTAAMPYLARLGRTYGHTTAYRALAHPSLPNYLALAGGSTFGVTDDADPSVHRVSGPSVFDQALAAGKTATTYAESMPANCTLTSSGRYAVRHNPWTYFSDRTERANCRRHDVPAGSTSSGALHRDITAGRLPTVGLLVPNVCDDAHDCSLQQADSWLRGWIQAIQQGPDWGHHRLAVVVTFDENDGSSPNTVLTTVLSPMTRHVVSSARFTHYSWTRYADQLIGARPLRAAANARSLRMPFHL